MAVDSKLKQIEKIVNAFNSEAITNEDFEARMQRVLKAVLTLVQNNKEATARAEAKADQAIKAVSEQHNLSLTELKKQTNQLFVKEKLGEMSTEQQKLFDALRGKFSILVDKKLDELTDEIKRRAVQGNTGERGMPGRPPTQEEIGLAFEPTVEGFKDAWEKKVQQVMATRPASGPNANAVQRIDLSSQCNGENKTFEVPSLRLDLQLTCSQFPFIYRPVVDYTLGRKELVMTDEVAAPAAGQTLLFTFVK